VASRLWRIQDRTTFVELRRRGRRGRRGPVQVTWLADPVAAGPPRAAFAVGRKVGGAVVRNRLRRRLRHVLAEQAGAMRPGAYLVAAGPAAVGLSPEELRTTVTSALRSVGALEDAA
jgi:ribonuclease P protein component